MMHHCTGWVPYGVGFSIEKFLQQWSLARVWGLQYGLHVGAMVLFACCILGSIRHDCRGGKRNSRRRSNRGGASRSWNSGLHDPPADVLARILEAVRAEKGTMLPPHQVQLSGESIRDFAASAEVESVPFQSAPDQSNMVEVEVMRPSTQNHQAGWEQAVQDHAAHVFDELRQWEQHFSPIALFRHVSNTIEGTTHSACARGMQFLSDVKKGN